MNRKEIKLLILISVLSSIALAILYLKCLNQTFDLKNVMKASSASLTLISAFWTGYFTWFWKWPLLKKIFYRPNVNGTWSGQIFSDWIDTNTGKETAPKDFYVVIRQSFLRIHLTTFTESFVGVSYSENFNLSKEKGLKHISYLYRKDTSITTSGNDHDGGAEIRLIESLTNELKGRYWTSQKTNGKISLVFISNTHVDSFIDAAKL